MSEDQGYIRVVNASLSEGFALRPSEKLITVDRANQVLGNRHDIKVKRGCNARLPDRRLHRRIMLSIFSGGS